MFAFMQLDKVCPSGSPWSEKKKPPLFFLRSVESLGWKMSPHSLFSGRKAGLEGVAEIKSANFLIEIQLLKSQGVLSSK